MYSEDTCIERKRMLSESGKYGGPQVSHQIQILTSNTNSPHQKQIPHIKIKFTTSNTNSPQQKQNRHSKNKFTTSKTNLSQQKQIPHIKNKSLTSKSKTQIKRSAVNERKLSPVYLQSRTRTKLHSTRFVNVMRE